MNTSSKDSQNFLVNKPTEEDLSGKLYDLNGDDKWNVLEELKGILGDESVTITLSVK